MRLRGNSGHMTDHEHCQTDAERYSSNPYHLGDRVRLTLVFRGIANRFTPWTTIIYVTIYQYFPLVRREFDRASDK